MRNLLIFLILLFCASGIKAQEYNFELNTDYSTAVESRINEYGSEMHTSIKPYTYNEINTEIDYDSTLQAREINSPWQSKFSRGLWNRIFNDHVINIQQEDFSIQMDPLFDFTFGKEAGVERTPYVNTRGFQLRGTIGPNVGFYTAFYENQASFPNYVQDFIRSHGVVPGQGKPRGFKTDSYDYAMATGYVSWTPSKYFNFQFGHGKNFWGDGYRSLLLSANAFNYPYLKISTKFWRIKYINLFTQFQDYRQPFSPELGYSRKYSSMHYLSINISKRVNLSLFEAIIWEAADSTGQRGFDVVYLNPVIFYRPVEFSIGSPDNALLGANLSVKIGQKNMAYGQLLLDEFRLEEVTSFNGWWANKQAFQIGFKSFDAFKLENLFLQFEYNYVRPFTYSHRIPIQSYGHYGQPLAHPLGANFMELISRVKYNYKRFYLHYQFMYAIYGKDKDNLNYGKDIFKDFDTYAREYNNYVGQGLRTDLMYNHINFSYLINPAYNLNFSIGYINRMEKNEEEDLSTDYFYVSLRTSLRKINYDF